MLLLVLRLVSRAIVSALVLFACGQARAHAHGGEPAAAARWSDGYTLVVLEPGADMRRAARWVRAQGGTVALELPPSCLAGWIPPAADAALTGHAGIRSVHRDVASLPEHVRRDRATHRAARFFARVARGELDFGAVAAAKSGAASEAQPDLVPGAGFAPGPGVLLPDAFVAPPIDAADVEANLHAQGILPRRKGAGDDALAATTETMTGTIAVALVFVESDGTGSDPNTHSWTASREDDIYDDAASALSWWSRRAAEQGDCWATFRLEPYFATEDARCRQWREPVLHPSTDFANAIAAVLGNLGFASGNHLARAAAFDAALRVQLDTDWAFSAFVACNPSGATQFTDGHAAWAYLGGPYVALLQRSFSWSFKQVFAHETAHAFRACDEYSVAGYGGCSTCAGCIDPSIPNGNCESCNASPATCMMRNNAYALCAYTIAQLGWGQRPCVPEALPPPMLTGIAPGVLVPAQEIDLVLQGDLFASGSTLDCGTGITMVSLVVVSPNEIRARVRVDVEAVPGPRDVALVGADGQVAVLPSALTVRATPRHYVAAGGGNRFPFETPADAATSLAVALASCSRGDTIYVGGGSWAPFAIYKTLVVSGSWDSGFASRWPEYPTVIEGVAGAPAVTIEGAANSTVLEGLVLRGGTGGAIAPPGLGPMSAGGGLLSIAASPVLRDCTLEGNSAGTDPASGAGGGAFFWGGAPVLERCLVRDNAAHRGGGVAFLACEARLVDVRIESNTGRAGGAGGGIAVLGGDVVVQGGAVIANRGARDGGGIHAADSPRVELVEGVRVEDNAATHDGGGLFAAASAVACRGVRFAGNTAGDSGGGLQSVGGVLVLDATLVGANRSAAGGAGVHAEGATGAVANVTAADNAGGAGVAWLASPAPVAVRAPVLARNEIGGWMTSGAVPVFEACLAWQNGGADWIGYDPGAGARVGDPRFAAPASRDYRLALGSAALDAGDPDVARADRDGSPNDCGAYGGPHAAPPAPSRVATVRARILVGRTRVEWTPSPSPGIAQYAVYRAASAAASASASASSSASSSAAASASASAASSSVASAASSVPASAASAPVEAPAGASVEGLEPVAIVPASQFEWYDESASGATEYAVVAVDSGTHASGATFATATQQPTDVGGPAAALALHPIAPNPVNPGAWVAFDLPDARHMSVDIYAADGRRVRALVAGVREAGSHRVYWDGRTDHGIACASGVYWVRLATGDATRTRRVVVVR